MSVVSLPDVGGVGENTVELSQNISYGVVRRYEIDNSSLHKDISYTNNSSNIGILPSKNFDYQHTKIMRWIFGCFGAFLVANITLVIALVVAFILIASLKSDIGSISSESLIAETGSLESRLNQLEEEIRNFLQTTQTELTTLRDTTFNRLNGVDADLTFATNLSNRLPILLNNTNEKISTQGNNLNIRINELFANVTNTTINIISMVSDKADEANRTTQQIVNSSAIQLATDIRSLHVFSSCEIVTALRLPFPSGIYRIGFSQNNSSLLNCTTNTALTCNGISGQWRRVAYLDTSQAKVQCPGSL